MSESTGELDYGISNRDLAKLITERLFVNGNGDKAKRLVLELEDGRDGGEWNRAAVEDQIVAVLDEERTY